VKDRIRQVNEVFKQELGKILLREIEMPEGTVVTLTRVEASGNLQQAKVYISVVPDERAEKVLKLLLQNIYDIQQSLNERLKMRPVPKMGKIKAFALLRSPTFFSKSDAPTNRICFPSIKGFMRYSK